MALASYADIKAAVARWLNRTDLDAAIPDFISIAEQRLARELRLWGMESTLTGAFTDGAFPIPANLVEPVRLSVGVGGQRRIIQYVSPQQFAIMQHIPGNPVSYTLMSGSIRVAPFPPDGTAYEFACMVQPAALSDANQTNLWTNTCPDVLLYAALCEASPYLGDDARVAVWDAKYQQAKTAVQDTDERSQVSGVLRIKTDNNLAG